MLSEQNRHLIGRDREVYTITAQDLETLLNAARQAGRDERKEGWHIIDKTTPRDRQVLVGAWVEGYWSCWTTRYCAGSNWPWGCDGLNGDSPTHWSELPAAPAPEGDGASMLDSNVEEDQ